MPNPLHAHLKCMYVFIYVLYLSIFILQQKKKLSIFILQETPPKKDPQRTHAHTYGHPMAE